MARDEAISAIETALKLLEAVRAKLREVVALKVIRGQDESFDRAEVAALGTEINDLRSLLTEVTASHSVIPAPSPDEIAAATRLLDDLTGLVVGDALVTGGLDVLKTGLATARDLRKKVTT